MQWQKPGATPDATDADLRACQLAAEKVPTIPTARTASGIEAQPADRDADRQMQLARRVGDCMRQRGYSLK